MFDATVVVAGAVTITEVTSNHLINVDNGDSFHC